MKHSPHIIYAGLGL